MLRNPRQYVILVAVTTAIVYSLFRFAQSPNIPLEPPSDPVWAGELLPTDKFYVKDNWEREYYLTAFSEYQNALYMKRAERYFPYIEAELKKRAMPDDLKYLAVAESALKSDAVSTAGASGIWQIMPDTARALGLRVDDAIDERNHFHKSTHAALDYLSKLHAEFGSWHLAAAAYNRGENGLARDMAAQKSAATYADLVLNPETERYVYRIAAIREVLEHPARYRLSRVQTDSNERSHAITVTGPIDNLDTWAISQKTTLRAVRELNPWILKSSLPVGAYEVEVPE